MDFFQPDNIYKHENSVEDNLLTNEYYTMIGEQDLILDGQPYRNVLDEKVYAKKTQKKDGSYKLSIRTGADGKLYNPIHIYGKEKSNTFLDNVCKSSNDKFKTVNTKTFTWYTQFLTTKNMACLYNAEREAE